MVSPRLRLGCRSTGLSAYEHTSSQALWGMRADVDGETQLLGSGTTRCALLHRTVHDAALERAQMIDHQLAFDVIVLVLHGDAQQVVRFELEPLAVAILGFDLHALG